MTIEVLKCKSCGALAISVDDTRLTTNSRAWDGHGSGKCAGQWTVMVDAEHEPEPDLKVASEVRWHGDRYQVRAFICSDDKRELKLALLLLPPI